MLKLMECELCAGATDPATSQWIYSLPPLYVRPSNPSGSGDVFAAIFDNWGDATSRQTFDFSSSTPAYAPSSLFVCLLIVTCCTVASRASSTARLRAPRWPWS